MMYKTSVLAALIAMTASVHAQWNCAVKEGGPKPDRIQFMKETYERVFELGHDTQTIDPLHVKTVHCDGLVYGATNVGGLNQDDTGENRDKTVASGAEVGDGKRCAWSVEGDGTNVGYFYDFEDDYSCGALGGTATAACDERFC